MTEPTPGSLGEVWEAWKKRRGQGEDVARQLAMNYVDANRDRLEARYGDLSREDCVRELTMHRKSGNQERVLELEVWLLSEFEPQHIGGKLDTTVRRGRNAR